MGRGVQAVMITIEGRRDAAFGTAERLTQAGVTTKLFIQPEDWPVGPPSNIKNSIRALEWAEENVTSEGFLFVEDDITIKPDRFERAIAAARELKELMFFYMHDKPSRLSAYPAEPWVVKMSEYARLKRGTLDGLIVPEGPKLMARDAQIYGTQCVFIPTSFVKFLLPYVRRGNPKRGGGYSFDTLLNYWRQDNDLPAYCFVPHPVQHLQNRELRRGSRIDVYSLSFGLQSDLEASRDRLLH